MGVIYGYMLTVVGALAIGYLLDKRAERRYREFEEFNDAWAYHADLWEERYF